MIGAAELFSREQRERVAQAVQEAETKTAAEIVPVVARVSGRYDRAEDVAGLWLGLILMALTWALWPARPAEPGSWGGMPAAFELLALVVSVLLGFFAGAALSARIDCLRRLFASRPEMREEVQTRARGLFFDQRVHHTEASTGLFLYVSLFEHLAVVLADQGVLNQLGQKGVDELCQQLTEGLHRGDATAALCETIRTAGDRLAALLPRVQGARNELHDALVTID
jgi:putative membrane protein